LKPERISTSSKTEDGKTKSRGDDLEAFDHRTGRRK
jgi:hypothetical protein